MIDLLIMFSITLFFLVSDRECRILQEENLHTIDAVILGFIVGLLTVLGVLLTGVTITGFLIGMIHFNDLIISYSLT